MLVYQYYTTKSANRPTGQQDNAANGSPGRLAKQEFQGRGQPLRHGRGSQPSLAATGRCPNRDRYWERKEGATDSAPDGVWDGQPVGRGEAKGQTGDSTSGTIQLSLEHPFRAYPGLSWNPGASRRSSPGCHGAPPWGWERKIPVFLWLAVGGSAPLGRGGFMREQRSAASSVLSGASVVKYPFYGGRGVAL